MSVNENVMPFPASRRYRPENVQFLLDMFQKHENLHKAPAWLLSLYNSALTVLEKQGLPTPRLERWKYTNLERALPQDLHPALPLYDVSGPADVVNPLQSEFETLWVRKWLQEDIGDRYHDRALYYLNAAFLEDGVVIDIPAGTVLEKPLEIIWNAKSGRLYNPRLIVKIGKGAAVTITEYHEGSGAYWKNAVAQIEVGQGAQFRHYRIVEDSRQAVNTQVTDLTLARDARYEGFSLVTGAGLSRHQMLARLTGENVDCLVNGVNLLRGGQHGDTTLEVQHEAPHCHSNQFFRSVLRDHAHGVYQGKVHVLKAAQKTDAYQLSNALILDEGAEMNTKPELEIYADDVSCSHGTTTGQLDKNALFYLRSRGLPEKEAKNMLIEAFLMEVTDTITDEAVRIHCEERVSRWLGH